MAKPYTFPVLFDDVKNISITDLRKWGYLKPNMQKTGVLTWSRSGIKTGSISIKTLTNNETGTLTLDYTCNETSYNYNVFLTSVTSNLQKGKIWYFVCAFTGKRCRKLHLIDERFIHRSALPSGMYQSQIHSKKWRLMEKTYGRYFDSEKYYRELHSKYFKRYYNGKPTKRYLKLLQKLKQSENISPQEIERLYLI